MTCTAYYESIYRQQIAQAAQESLRLAEHTRDIIQQQTSAGVRAGVDRVQAEIELERAASFPTRTVCARGAARCDRTAPAPCSR